LKYTKEKTEYTKREIYYYCEISRKRARIVFKRIFDEKNFQKGVLGVLSLLFDILHCSHHLQE